MLKIANAFFHVYYVSGTNLRLFYITILCNSPNNLMSEVDTIITSIFQRKELKSTERLSNWLKIAQLVRAGLDFHSQCAVFFPLGLEVVDLGVCL